MKKLLSVMMVFILVSTHLAMADPASAGKKTDSSITVSINGETLSEKGIVKNGRTFLPVAVIGKKLDLPIEWKQSTKTAVIKGSSTVEVKIGAKQALVNGQVVSLDAPAFVHNGRTMLPVAFIAKYLGHGISYDAKAKIVAIDARQSNQQPPQPQDQTNPESQPQQPSQSEQPSKPKTPHQSTREFVLEPLPELYPATEYNDRARNLDLIILVNVDVPFEEMAQYGIFVKRIKQLDLESQKAKSALTLRDFMKIYAVIAELSANSDSRNIPVNIAENSSDGLLWKKAAKTGVFQSFIDHSGKVDMDQPLTWPEVCHLWSKHYDWMGVDPYKYPNVDPLHSFDLNGYNGPYIDDIYKIVNIGYYVPFTDGGMNNRKLYNGISNKKIEIWEFYVLLEIMSGEKLIKY